MSKQDMVEQKDGQQVAGGEQVQEVVRQVTRDVVAEVMCLAFVPPSVKLIDKDPAFIYLQKRKSSPDAVYDEASHKMTGGFVDRYFFSPLRVGELESMKGTMIRARAQIKTKEVKGKSDGSPDITVFYVRIEEVPEEGFTGDGLILRLMPGEYKADRASAVTEGFNMTFTQGGDVFSIYCLDNVNGAKAGDTEIPANYS